MWLLCCVPAALFPVAVEHESDAHLLEAGPLIFLYHHYPLQSNHQSEKGGKKRALNQKNSEPSFIYLIRISGFVFVAIYLRTILWPISGWIRILKNRLDDYEYPNWLIDAQKEDEWKWQRTAIKSIHSFHSIDFWFTIRCTGPASIRIWSKLLVSIFLNIISKLAKALFISNSTHWVSFQ